MAKSEKKYPLEKIVDSDNNLITAMGSGAGELFFESYFNKAEKEIRIASSYFNLRGFEIGDRNLRTKNIAFSILVGSHSDKYNQGKDGKEVQKAILSGIKEELKECNHNWADAIQRLVDKLNNNTFTIKDARETNRNPLFHAKFYIIDDIFLFHGSANYSGAGLKRNAEQLSLINNRIVVKRFIEWYNKIASTAKDLKGDLLKLLKDWLNLSQPFDIYLTFIHVFNNWSDSDIKSYLPNYYQKAVIQSSYKQIEEYGGSLLVAATGLGKTIIGAEIAYKLQKANKTKRTIVIAPPNIHGDWKKQLELRDITYHIFSISILFKGDSEKERDHHQIVELKNKLEESNEFTTIIIDEVHLYKNQKVKEQTDEKISSVYERLVPAVGKKAKILLLTATPYSANIINVQSILHLLPHNGPTSDLYKLTEEWTVDDIKKFISLPIVTIIGLPHVLKLSKERGDIDSVGRVFVEFGKERRYFPKQISIVPMQYEIFLEDKVAGLFESGLFSQKHKFHKNTVHDDTGQTVNSSLDILYNEAVSSWLSSPFALREAIKQNINSEDKIESEMNLFNVEVRNINHKIDNNHIADGYSPELRHSQPERIKKLEPILGLIDENIKLDDKFIKLKSIIETRYKLGGSKILIFVERYQTAIYLLESLKKGCENKVTSTIELVKKNQH